MTSEASKRSKQAKQASEASERHLRSAPSVSLQLCLWLRAHFSSAMSSTARPFYSGVALSSKTDMWSTPQAFFDELDGTFRFTLDVCATRDNAKTAHFFTEQDDGLAQEWGSNVCWMNPPYGRTIGRWMKKALEASRAGATVVCLVPARTDTAWWHDYAAKGDFWFVRGRLKFGESKNAAPFPSAVVVFRPAVVVS